jgi:ubiquinone/menaquinone biosynthesis C-methylase UbiE
MEKLFTYCSQKYTKQEIESILQDSLAMKKKNSRLLAILELIEGRKILDVGCHVGVMARLMEKEGREILGVDVLEPAIEIARTFNQTDNVMYRCGDIFDMKFQDNAFDCVLFLETIEHVDNPDRYLKEFLRILKPGGSLIISTPNAVSCVNILYQLPIFTKRRQKKFIESLSSEPRDSGTQLDHIFLWDFRTLLRLLVRNGFVYSQHRFADAPPFPKRIGDMLMPVIGTKEMRFLLPLLGPYLSTIIAKVKKTNG